MAERSEADRGRAEDEKLVMTLGIVFAAAFAGYLWAGLVNSFYNAGLVGGTAGFFVGVALVLTARLAARK